MASKLTRKMPSFEGVAAGQTAVCKLPTGRTYHQLSVTYGGATLAQLDELRILANGEVIQRYVELTELDSVNQYEGRAAAGGVIMLDFDRYNLRTRDAEEITSLGTGLPRGDQPGQDPNPISTLTCEIDINAAAVAPTLSARAIQSLPRISGLVKKVRKYTYTAGAAGEFEIADIPKRGIINKLVVGNHAVIGVTRIEIERDNFVIFDRTAAENIVIQTDGVRVPQAGYVVADPTEGGNGAEGFELGGVQDFRVRLTLTAGGSVPLIVETLEPIEFI